MTAARTLLRDLRLQGVRLAAHGDRVHVEAPIGVVSPDAREQLAAVKADVISQLTVEERFADMSCSEFGRQDFALELRVPGVDGTIWLVPRSRDAAWLVSGGISRGRILTACELADLLSIETLTADDFLKITRLRVAFGAEIVAITRDVDSSTEPRHAWGARAPTWQLRRPPGPGHRRPHTEQRRVDSHAPDPCPDDDPQRRGSGRL